MLGSTMFELALGMAFIYLLLSLLVSAIREAVEARMKTRAAYLERGITQMLGAHAGSFYAHPLVKSLYVGSSLPSYVPRSVFAAVVLEKLRDAAPGLEPRDPQAYPEWVRSLPRSQPFEEAAAAALGAARNLDEAVKALEDWYDSAMDRVAGWYKRRTQQIVFWIGLLVAVAFNVDSIALVKYLDTDPRARAALVQAAEGNIAPAKSPSPPASAASAAASAASAAQPDGVRQADETVHRAASRLVDLHLPIGWDQAARDRLFGVGQVTTASDLLPPKWTWARAADIVSALPGWLLTAFAISFGAPFWFDVLNKVMVVRSTVKPKEKSGDEASEDRRGAKA